MALFGQHEGAQTIKLAYKIYALEVSIMALPWAHNYIGKEETVWFMGGSNLALFLIILRIIGFIYFFGQMTL